MCIQRFLFTIAVVFCGLPSVIPKGVPYPNGIVAKSTHCGTSTYIAKNGQRKTLISPGWPSNYADDSYCSWILKGKGNKVLRLEFKTLELEYDSICNNDHVTVYDDNSGQLMGKFCGEMCRNTVVTMPSNRARVVFQSNNVMNYKGFKIKFWRVSASSVAGVQCGCAAVDGCLKCGGDLSADSGLVTSPNFPIFYPNEALCIWRVTVDINMFINFRLTALDIEYESACGYDHLKIQLPNANAHQAMICGDTCLTEMSLSSNVIIVIFSSDYLETGGGFQLDYTALAVGSTPIDQLFCNCGESDGCFGPSAVYERSATTVVAETTIIPVSCTHTITTTGGQLYSPGYPEHYGNNQHCIFSVSVSTGMNILIVFQHFSLEYHSSCIWDRLVIYEGDLVSDISTTHCGSETGSLVVNSEMATIEFTSDFSVTSTGFYITYEEISPGGNSDGSVCGQNYIITRGVITSPNYPDNYPHNIVCEWTITVEPDEIVELTRHSFHLESHPSCSRDSLTIYDGSFDISTAQHEFCGNYMPYVFVSSSNILSLRFTTDPTVSYAGFNVSFNAISADTLYDTPQPPVDCGRVPADLTEGMIVGGSTADPHDYPWQVIIQEDYTFVCGGSILSDTWVVTAAHCVSGSTPHSFIVVAGAHHITNFEDSKQYMQVAEIVVHASYNSWTLENDIALLRLVNPLTWTNYVRPICLPAAGAPVGTNCAITGWGNTETYGYPSELQVAWVPILDNVECDASYSSNSWYTVYSNMICAGFYEGGVDTCSGDSGGPLACPDVNGVYNLQGITSWGIGCADVNYPGVFTRVALYTPWVVSSTGGEVTSP